MDNVAIIIILVSAIYITMYANIENIENTENKRKLDVFQCKYARIDCSCKVNQTACMSQCSIGSLYKNITSIGSCPQAGTMVLVAFQIKGGALRK